MCSQISAWVSLCPTKPLMRWDLRRTAAQLPSLGPSRFCLQLSKWLNGLLVFLWHTSLGFLCFSELDFSLTLTAWLCVHKPAQAASVISSSKIGFTWPTERTPGPTIVAGTSPKNTERRKFLFKFSRFFKMFFKGDHSLIIRGGQGLNSWSELNWMNGLFSLACLVTGVRSDMQLLGRSTSLPVTNSRINRWNLLGGSLSPFISNARWSKPLLKIQILHRQRKQ